MYQNRNLPLFLETPAQIEKRVDRLVDHFRHAEHLFYISKPRGIPNPRTLLWLLLQDAMHTHRHVPDRERAMVARVGSTMPGTRDMVNETYSREMSRLLDGMPQYDAVQVRVTVRDGDIDRMVDVMDLLRFVVGGRQGKDVLRLKRCVLARAAGASIEQCGRIWDRQRTDFDRRAMHDLKERVIGQILAGLDAEFHLVRTGRGFRRLTLKEIERRKRQRKIMEAGADAG